MHNVHMWPPTVSQSLVPAAAAAVHLRDSGAANFYWGGSAAVCRWSALNRSFTWLVVGGRTEQPVAGRSEVALRVLLSLPGRTQSEKGHRKWVRFGIELVNTRIRCTLWNADVNSIIKWWGMCAPSQRPRGDGTGDDRDSFVHIPVIITIPIVGGLGGGRMSRPSYITWTMVCGLLLLLLLFGNQEMK